MAKQEKRIFVMGDIHGAFQELKQCLNLANFDYEKDTLIQLGDVVDGGQDSYNCVEELIKIKNLIPIKGNHDVWFKNFLDTGHHPQFWNFGGYETLKSYLAKTHPMGKILRTRSGYKTTLVPESIPKSHFNFFSMQKLYWIDKLGNLFIHGGFDCNKDFYCQDEENYLFDRSLWKNSKTLNPTINMLNSINKFRHIYIGHTADCERTIPVTRLNITNMDTGAGINGNLSIMEIENNNIWQAKITIKTGF